MALGQEVARIFAGSSRWRPTGWTSSAASPGSSLFSALSFLQLPPIAWGVVAAVVFAVLLGRERGAGS